MTLSSYYYLCSSLPSLYVQEAMPITRRSFLDDCERIVSKTDFDIISNADIDGTSHSDHPILRVWDEFELGFRREMAQLRGARLGWSQDIHGQLRSYDQSFSEALRIAVNHESPYEAELIVAQQRWKYLDSLSTNHAFDLVMLIIYHLKLQILERLSVMNNELGEQEFDGVFSNIQSSITTF